MDFEFPCHVTRYLRRVSARLYLPASVRKRVIHDLKTSIHARWEAGESYDEILTSLGKPSKAASDLNEQMKEFAYNRKPIRFAFLILAVFSIFSLLIDRILSMILTWSYNEMSSIGIIGGADGPTAIFVTTATNSGIPWDSIFTWALFAVGLFGFWHFGHLKPKNEA